MPENDDEGLRARGEKLAKDLKVARSARSGGAAPQVRRPDGNAAGLSLAMRCASELVAAVAVGAGFGWGLDRLFHTRPAFLIVFLLLGSVAGMWNVIRATMPKAGR